MGRGGPKKVQNEPLALARAGGWTAGPLSEGPAGKEQVLGKMKSSGLAVWRGRYLWDIWRLEDRAGLEGHAGTWSPWRGPQ